MNLILKYAHMFKKQVARVCDVESEFKDKFVAFIDVLGFSSMIESAEKGKGRNLSEIREILAALGSEDTAESLAKHGPKICPKSSYLQRDLDFRVTQISDCAIVSAEVSPAGAINVVHHCWLAALTLLTKGVLVRGYITRGPIYHEGTEFYGTGYHNASRREASVTAFKMEADEKGTPFVEIDPSVCSYISAHGDKCVQDMFSRFVKEGGGVTGLFPFKRLAHSFIVDGFRGPPFDSDKEKDSNNNVRKSLNSLKERVMEYVDASNEAAVRKTRHYIAALDAQLKVCDQTDEMIDFLNQPYPRGHL